MSRQIITGIDIGSFQVKVVMARAFKHQGHLAHKIIGTGIAESRGVSRGYITDIDEAVHSVHTAVMQAEKTSGEKIRRAYVSFGGVGLESIVSSGSAAISKADMEITERDVTLVLETAETSIPQDAMLNKKVINTIPIEYKMDGKVSWGDVLGLKAHKLEAKVLFITCLEHHLDSLIKTVESANVEVVDVVAAPIAASFVTITKKEKRVGSLLVDLGAETTSLVTFENNNIISLEVLPYGGNDLTGDIALGLKIPLEEAENLKVTGHSHIVYTKKQLDNIVSSRFKDIFIPIDKHLKGIGRQSLLPAGVVMTGGTSLENGVKNFAEAVLELPARVAEIHFGNPQEGRITNNVWSVACGLCIVGFNSDDVDSSLGNHIQMDSKRLGRSISNWLSQLLP